MVVWTSGYNCMIQKKNNLSKFIGFLKSNPISFSNRNFLNAIKILPFNNIAFFMRFFTQVKL